MKHMTKFIALAVMLTACGGDKLGGFDPGEKEGPEIKPWEPVNPAPPITDLTPPQECETGAILGRLCVPGEELPANLARVYIWAADCNGEDVKLYSTQAKSDGQFGLLDVPVGNHTLYVEHALFGTNFKVDVSATQLTTLDNSTANAPTCGTVSKVRTAVITGANDKVEVHLETLGIPFHTFNHLNNGAIDFLSSLEVMQQYETIYVNCNVRAPERPDGGNFFFHETVPDPDYEGAAIRTYDYTALPYENLRAFVEAGGNLFVNDLSWPLVEHFNPALLNFYGAEDTNEQEVYVGDQQGERVGIIQTEQLQLFLGAEETTLQYNLPAWVVLEDVDDAVDIDITGNIKITDRRTRLLNNGAELGLFTLNDSPLMVSFSPYPEGGRVIFTTFHFIWTDIQETPEHMVNLLNYAVIQL
jgi:hypothetical protein